RLPRSLRLAVFGLLAAAIIFAVYQNYFRPPGPKVVFASRVVPFSGLSGREGMPAFSPDGRQIAFVWDGGDQKNLDVYIKVIGEGEPVRLTRGETDALNPVFSPDGKRIAFFRSLADASMIYSIPALG